MAAPTRPYFMILNDVEHMVEAPNPAAAVRHVVGAALTELRPARGAEVAAWVRGNRDIPIAGAKVPPAAPVTQPGSEEGERLPANWSVIDWLARHGADRKAVSAYAEINRTERMTLEQFDVLRERCPAFGTAIVAHIAGSDASDTVLDAGLADVRAALEQEPFPLSVVTDAIVAVEQELADAEQQPMPDEVGDREA